jgi:hypothetical protein
MTRPERIREIVSMARKLRVLERKLDEPSSDAYDIMDQFDELAEKLVDHILDGETLAALAPVGGPFDHHYAEGRA